jgi:hypothetical protein
MKLALDLGSCIGGEEPCRSVTELNRYTDLQVDNTVDVCRRSFQSYKICFVRFEVITAVRTSVWVFRIVKPYGRKVAADVSGEHTVSVFRRRWSK